jgi:hypothetical protein
MSAATPLPQLGDSLLIVVEAGAVRCPGCCATAPTSASVVHEDGCPIYRQIEAARFLFVALASDPDDVVEVHG